MNLFDAVTFGIVEGITEFLPVSSTGHLILTSRILGLTQTEFLKSFEIAIQLGAILSVIVLYGKTICFDFQIVKKIFTAFIPTAVVGLALYKLIKGFLLGDVSVVLWSLLVGGVILILFEKFYKDKSRSTETLSDISYRQAFLIGIFQSLAVIPGVSRAAATIIGGLLLGLKRKTIVEFSFLLAVPTMLAATALDLVKSENVFLPEQWFFLGVGFFTSFVIALLSIKFLLRFIQDHNFVVFGAYRIFAAVLFWLIVRPK